MAATDTPDDDAAVCGFNSDVYSDHTLCLRRKRKRDSEDPAPQHVGVVKVLLARASPFFKALFETPMQEDTTPGTTHIFLDDEEDSALDVSELHDAYLRVLRAAHSGSLRGVPPLQLPIMLRMADKYLFAHVAGQCAAALTEAVATNRALALKALTGGHCPESLALQCVEALSPGLQLVEVYALLNASYGTELAATKARTTCSQFLLREYGAEWTEPTPQAVLALELPAFELLLQSDDLVVRSENVIFQSIMDWLRCAPSRKPYFEALWRHVRKYYLTSGFLLEVVASTLMVSERELLSILRKRLGTLHCYEWGKPRCYRNPPLRIEIPALAPGSKWQHRVWCNAVEMLLVVEARPWDQTHEVTINAGGYSPVLQRELQARVMLLDGSSLPCNRWIAGSSRILIPEYQQCQEVVLLMRDVEMPEPVAKAAEALLAAS